MNRWLANLRRFRRLSASERRALAAAFLVLPAVSLALRLTGLGRTRRLLRACVGRAQPASRVGETHVARSVARLVARAASHIPGHPACLTQALTLWFLLARQGIESEVRIGVQKEAGVFGAHAWVELDGQILLDTPDVVDRYAVIA
jgi:hypothetical protein